MSLLPTPRQFAVDANGAPMAGAKLYFYEAGSSSPKTVYADSTLATAHTQPVVADSAGLWPAIYLGAGDYKVEQRNAGGVAVWTQDSVTGSSSSQARVVSTVAEMKALTTGQAKAYGSIQVLGYYVAGDGGGGLFVWDASNTATDNGGTVIRPASGATSGRWIRVKAGPLTDRQFGAKLDGVTDDTAAVQAALTAAAGTSSPTSPTGGAVHFPEGTRMISTEVNVTGCGMRITAAPGAIFKRVVGSDCTLLAIQGDYNRIEGVTFDGAWFSGSTETFSAGRRAVVYLTGNHNVLSGLTIKNGQGNIIGMNGYQRFGVQTNPVTAGVPAYGPSLCCIGNVIENCTLVTGFYTGIAQFWTSHTKIVNCHIEDVGGEAITCDTYSQDTLIQGNTLKNCVVAGRSGGVGAIGMDSSLRCRIIGNTIDGVYMGATSFISGGIVMQNEENDTNEHVIEGNVFLNCDGPGIVLKATQLTSASLYGTVGSYASCKRNIIQGNSFINCGGSANFKATLGATGRPSNTGVLIQYNAANPSLDNIVGTNNLFGHAVLDAPDAVTNINNPARPNKTRFGDFPGPITVDATLNRARKISFGGTVAVDLLHVYDDGTSAYGFGMQPQEMLVYAASGNRLTFGHRNNDGSFTGRWRVWEDGVMTPIADNAYNLGAGPFRVATVYAGTGTINTSDGREKTAVAPLSQEEIAAAIALSREIGLYQWLAAIETKGDAARRHAGMTVQRAISIMQAHGLDPMRYGFICYDQWAATPEVVNQDGAVVHPAQPAGDRYSFRMDELLVFIARGLAQRQDDLEARLSALEAA